MIDFNIDKACVIADEARKAFEKATTEKDPKERIYWAEQLHAHLKNLLTQTQQAVIKEIEDSPELLDVLVTHYSIAALEDNLEGVYAGMILQHLRDQKIIPDL